VFVEEVKQARLAANLGKMTPEELTKAKEAWAEALTLEKAAVEDAMKVGTYNTRIKWGIAEVEARPFGPGYWGRRTPQGNARVNAYELKLNPNNGSFFLPHPDGGFVQFENIAGTVLQDRKLIASPRSIYMSQTCRRSRRRRFSRKHSGRWRRHRRPGCPSSGWCRSRARSRSSTSCSRIRASRSWSGSWRSR
jgi:hypothetical protein